MKYDILIAHKPFKCFKNMFIFSIVEAKSDIRLRILVLKISQVEKRFNNFHLPFGWIEQTSKRIKPPLKNKSPQKTTKVKNNQPTNQQKKKNHTPKTPRKTENKNLKLWKATIKSSNKKNSICLVYNITVCSYLKKLSERVVLIYNAEENLSESNKYNEFEMQQ